MTAGASAGFSRGLLQNILNCIQQLRGNLFHKLRIGHRLLLSMVYFEYHVAVEFHVSVGYDD